MDQVAGRNVDMPIDSKPPAGTHTTPLKEIDLRIELARISGKKWIPSVRANNTGVGATLERELGLPETNVSGIADCLYRGFPTEIKSRRTSSHSMLTLFTKEATTQKANLKELIKTYGKKRADGNLGLSTTVHTQTPNKRGLKLTFDPKSCDPRVVDVNAKLLWGWKFSELVGKFRFQLLVVEADVQASTSGTEKFWYRRASLYVRLDAQRLKELAFTGGLVYDFRSHERPDLAPRNHGGGFRVRTNRIQDFLACFERAEAIL